MKKAAQLKAERLFRRPRTPREGRPPKERNGQRLTSIPRKRAEVKPAGQISRPGRVKAGLSGGFWPPAQRPSERREAGAKERAGRNP